MSLLTGTSSSDTSLTVAVVGAGRLGLCFALHLESLGINVLAHDVNEAYINSIQTKTLETKEPFVKELLQESTKLQATTNLGEVVNASDLIWIFVPTPSTNDSYDHSILSNCLEQINRSASVEGKIIIIGSTILPGYINKIASKLCPKHHLVYNPSFIAQGNIIEVLRKPDVILIGSDNAQHRSLIEDFYCNNLHYSRDKIHTMDAISAEIAKISLNCFITTKISFANMVGLIAQKTGVDPNPILTCIGNDTRVGNKCLKFGYGFGGPCFPRDNKALITYARSIDVEPSIARATDEFNNNYVKYISHNLIENFEENLMYHPSSSVARTTDPRIIIEDVNYKVDCPLVMLDESHSLKVANLLADNGYPVTIKDRKDVIEAVKALFGSKFDYLEK